MDKTNDDVMPFNDRRISVNRAMAVLARNKVKVSEDEAAAILDFLYQMATAYNNLETPKISRTFGETRTVEKIGTKSN